MGLILTLVVVLVIALWVRSSRQQDRINELEERVRLIKSLELQIRVLSDELRRMRRDAAPASAPGEPMPQEAPPAAEPVQPAAVTPAPDVAPAWTMRETPAPAELVQPAAFAAAATPAEAPPIEPAADAVNAPPPQEPRAPRRPSRTAQEWEALVGENWLNKAGALVVVIGIALFLAYSVTHLSPAGRVTLALAVSFTLIGGGVALERRRTYTMFARGLLGAGWAALYFTAYAMYALEAARVIGDPLTGAIVLMAVAVGMIVHSLQYRSEVVTGIAYFAAFASLALTPVSAFAVLALAPLAASLLYVAYRFEWFSMALFGLVATYGTALYKATGTATVFESQSIVAAYWLLFEAFDLLRSAKGLPAVGAARWLFPLNAVAALAMSYAKWMSTAPAQLHWFFAGAAGAYLAGALARRRRYKPAMTLAAALAVPAIFLGFTGLWINAGLLVEAELLFLAALWLREEYLGTLAQGVFAVALLKLCLADVGLPGRRAIAGVSLYTWTPVALVTSVVFYANRVLKRPGLAYSHVAAALGALVIGFEVNPEFLGVAWVALAAVLFELGFWTRLTEFRWQGYAGAALGCTTLLALNVFVHGAHPWMTLGGAMSICYIIAAQALRTARIPQRERDAVRDGYSLAGTFLATVLLWQVAPRDFLGLVWMMLGAALLEAGLRCDVKWFLVQADMTGGLGIATLAGINVLGIGGVPQQQWAPLAAGALLGFAVTARLYGLGAHERRQQVALSAGNLFLAAMLWYLLPGPLVAVSWAAMTLLNMELSLWRPVPGLRLNAHLLAAATFGRMFLANLAIAGRTFAISHRLLTVVPFAAACYYCYGLLSAARDRLARAYLWAAAILIVALLRFELGRTMAVVGWAIFGLALLYFGVRRGLADLRWQSYALALGTFGRSWNTNFYAPESLMGMPVRVLTGAIVIASFYLGEFLLPRLGEDRIDVKARTVFSMLATTLLTVLIFYEVSGGFLTVAWSLEGIALLVTGFATRERSLRLAGLALFLFCVLKVFLYDLRQLETLYRILSFIVLGLLLLGASWIYTRFREQLKQYL